MSASAQNTRVARNPIMLGSVLRRAWPRHTAKRAAAVACSSIRTAQAWVSDRCAPSLPKLLEMAQRDDNLRAEMVRLLMETANVGKVEEGVRAVARNEAASARRRAAGSGEAPVSASRAVARPRRSDVTR